MNPDDLLDSLTAPTSSAEHLVATARRLAHRRQTLREGLAAAAILAIATAGISRLVPSQPVGPPLSVIQSLPTPAPLSPDELLDAFGDQPVALVTYPDGRQQLLAILRSPSRNSPPR
jgi:hypothetical protein